MPEASLPPLTVGFLKREGLKREGLKREGLKREGS
jgi:hypothetical protein